MKQLFLVLMVVFGLSMNAEAMDCNDRILRLPISEITRVLQTNPEAADTLEGIHLYWIRWEGFPESIQVTQAALTCLEGQGVIEQVRFGNRILWRRVR